MYLVEQFKKSQGLGKYDTASSITCNLDVLAHYITSGQMPKGASKSEMEETLELATKLYRSEIVFVYDRVSFSEAYIKLIDKDDLVVVRYAVAPGWNTWKVNATNDLVDRLQIRGKVVTDKEIIAKLLGLPDEDKSEDDKPGKTEQTTSGLRFDWGAQASAPTPQRRSTDKPMSPGEISEISSKLAPAEPATSSQQSGQSTDNNRPPANSPAPGDNQMASAFREAHAQRTRGGNGNGNGGQQGRQARAHA